MPTYYSDGKFVSDGPATAGVFDSKSQLAGPHLPLLAIACLAETMFPDAVRVSGDITLGQCHAAQRLVREVLGKEISVPVQFDAERLIPRVQKIYPDDEMKQYCLLDELYRGERYSHYQDLVKSNFSRETLFTFYFQDLTAVKLNKVVRAWMELHLPLVPFFQKAQSVGLSMEQLVSAIVHEHVYLDSEFILSDTDPDAVSFVQEFSGIIDKWKGINPDIQDRHGLSCAFLFLIESELKEAFPETDVLTLFEDAIRASDDFARAYAADYYYEPLLYNSNTYGNLVHWKPGATIDPKREEILVNKTKEILRLGEQAWPKFSALDALDRFCRINELNGIYWPYHFYTSKEVWEYICDHVMDEDIIKPYLGLVSKKIEWGYDHDFANVMAMKPDLFAYIIGKAKEA
jgi:hypothetical protein